MGVSWLTSDPSDLVVLQPGTFCNLNCSYCYLPDRQVTRFMPVSVVSSIASTIASRTNTRMNAAVRVLWHGCEPLALGKNRFTDMLDQFETARREKLCTHSLQTNATLIDDDWCELLKHYKFNVGVSLDGDRLHNSSRLNWSRRGSFDKALAGIERLRAHKIRFGIIAVVNQANICDATQVYRFLASLRPASISFNVEELEGSNTSAAPLTDTAVRRFWSDLLRAWVDDASVPIRQFGRAFIVLDQLARKQALTVPVVKSLYPTVDIDGNVFMLSPELLSAKPRERERFIVGNVLQEDLDIIVSGGRHSWYVESFVKGVRRCEAECAYFAFCHGGQASNKYFETGEFDVTETKYCRNTKIAPVRALYEFVESRQSSALRQGSGSESIVLEEEAPWKRR